MCVPKKFCHWLFPETKTAETAVYAKDVGYQTCDEVKFLSDELKQEGPYCHDGFQYNCGRCPMCRQVWKARIKREIRNFNRSGSEKVAWQQRDKSKYGSQHKELSELEKCINLLITKWQRQDGITPSQPGESPFHTCPVCHYKVPPSKDVKKNLPKEDAKRCAEAIDDLSARLATQARIKEKQEYGNEVEDKKVPAYIKPVHICTDMIEGDWLTATHVLLSQDTSDGGKIWTGRTFFPDASRMVDESSDEETDNVSHQSRTVSQKMKDDQGATLLQQKDCKTHKMKDTLGVEEKYNDEKVMQQLYNVD